MSGSGVDSIIDVQTGRLNPLKLYVTIGPPYDVMIREFSTLYVN